VLSKETGIGLGLVEYSQFLIENGIKTLAVATVFEAIELRKSGIKEDILMLSATSSEDELQELIKNDIILTLGSEEAMSLANTLGKSLAKDVRAHIKIDTGLGRYGFIYNDGQTIVDTIKQNSNIKIEGMYSHFSVAHYKNDKWTILQFHRFMDIVKVLQLNDINPNMFHMCNSPAFLNYPDMHLNAARIGSAFLGRVDCQSDASLRKIGQVKVNITEIKVIPKGYNVGYLNSYKTTKTTKIAIIQFRIYRRI